MQGETRKPGERRLQILQTLAAMLQEPQPGKITTAALAARIGVSEAALYRHFSSKAQMYEGLIEFIEQTLFGLIARITADTPSPSAQIEAILSLLLNFAAKNPGMTRVLIGDALVHENERLQKRINQLHDRIEAQLRQCLRFCDDKQSGLSGPLANLLQCIVVGRWHQFAKSGFSRPPDGDVDLLISRLLDVHPA
ncbi:MAG: nucleoid occlusion factor SlmA [Thiobacillus sp. 63-78]|uniref:nucleoid occlusion factor SlmA n=1 Tax=Thiobacillus sp. 63-78 TaxID=1895859 RepID=UPI00086ED375|nr:nucleoid occlusion factor SlmA [Thiobacillus sp. 63-78]MBN8762576.1 nucleoid occlusion factor SlmA [Thiobacillus sp.]ODV14095.1 MAG: nucleoid occlusion factor SlmA [Thiobacillus sp. SCN 64-317]MBN8766042.1 nucleoid occlusion factor SlmA [Thiobacillus sp.]MBN8774019.1 nucleoid occlusion factor SlmA [Thiobacillus sp.]OJZ15815.1 MAG: nucleoid occlusion factor SlmA [Thiobacillus sp. 63-78]